MPPSECSLVIAIFTTIAELAFVGVIPSALFSAFLAVGPLVLPEAEAILQSQSAYDRLLSYPLPLSSIPIQEKRNYEQAIRFFFSMLSTSFKFYEMNIHHF